MVIKDAGGWRPIHENHAIAVMAAVVTFAQTVPDLTLRKILRSSEDTAFAAGLKSRHSTKALQFSIDAKGVSQSEAASGIQGQLFNSLVETTDGVPISTQVAEQLQVDQAHVIYRTWQYVSWRWQSDRIRKLMTPALEIAKGTVAFASIRFEYLDRFWFDGDATKADPKQLLRMDSPVIAPHVFAAPDLWHSHTGAFLASGGQFKRLQQVMIDALDEPSLPQDAVAPVRWVNITTALEDRFMQPPAENEDIDVDDLFQRLDTMHASLKDTLAIIITNEMAERIFLRGT
jgi:hypothetical protein